MMPVGSTWDAETMTWNLADFPWGNYSSIKVYYDEATEKAPFPYIVYSFEPIITQDESSDTFILDVDGWDAPPTRDTEPLERLMERIDGDGNLENPTGLNERVIITDRVTLILRREGRYSIPDEDKTIKRRRYTYQVTVFERSEN
jgi:hypothetical protein